MFRAYKIFLTLIFIWLSEASLAADKQNAYVASSEDTKTSNEIIWEKGRKIAIYLPTPVRPVLTTAIEIFGNDIKNVISGEIEITYTPEKADIIIVINDKSAPIPQSYSIKNTGGRAIEITAHDSHGAAYGLLELSRLIGVSPWEWWADCVPDSKDQIIIPADYQMNESPSVKYRGIFINDEDWGLMPWSCRNFDKQETGVIGPKTTAKIFELLLRLRANTYWPPMHECSVPFFLTPGNREMADKYGIYIGGSHCEPMASSTAGEWPRRGVGEYDYVTNSDNVKSFWESRVDEVANQEIIYTIGMRGVHDGAMKGAKGVEQQKEVLSQVISDQREMLRTYDIPDAPQVFIPYKEVLDIYKAGLEVPEDVTLMWCDDNYGYIRHFPDSIERNREGGNGIYYHVSYWGRPHDYLWLGTFSPGLLYQQMSSAYDRGIERMWILNVGDIKPAEYQIELFMDMAWNIDRVRHTGVEEHTKNFLIREFGDSIGQLLLPVMKEHYRLAFIRKPEFMGNTRTEERDKNYYNTIRDLPWCKDEIISRLGSYAALSDSVEKYSTLIPNHKKDAFFQLVKYPVQAADQMNRKFLYGQLARHRESDWRLSDAAYDSIQSLTNIYNNEKWDGIMSSHPRNLPVFNRLTEEYSDSSLCPAPPVIKTFNGTDGTGWRNSYEWVGYGNGAVGIDAGDSVRFDFNDTGAQQLKLRICMLPTHSTNASPLRYTVMVDGRDCGTVEYSTYGRSEEWKENVLTNRSCQDFIVELKENSSHNITISSHADGVVLDQVILISTDNENL